jgi:hypothetical protein
LGAAHTRRDEQSQAGNQPRITTTKSLTLIGRAERLPADRWWRQRRYAIELVIGLRKRRMRFTPQQPAHR